VTVLCIFEFGDIQRKGLACAVPVFHCHMLFVDDDDETATNSESVVSKSHLSELCSEAAKLKSMGVMNQVVCC